MEGPSWLADRCYPLDLSNSRCAAVDRCTNRVVGGGVGIRGPVSGITCGRLNDGIEGSTLWLGIVVQVGIIEEAIEK